GQQRFDGGGSNRRPDPITAFLLLWGSEECRLAAPQSADDGQAVDPAEREPDAESPQGIAPGAALGPTQGPEAPQHAGDEKREWHDQHRTGQLADRQPVMEGGGDGR